uniref:Uncharacterized protein n=1 Tax=Anopheles atroparvus TaxID=41427 RepID=A0A182J512_ANOAO
MDVCCLSLDEIINSKKKQNARANRNTPAAKVRGGVAAPGPVAGARRNQPKRVTDARDIICMKTRKKIVDARDRLNEILRQTDARDRLRDRAMEAERQASFNGGGTAGSSNTNRGRRRSRSISIDRSPRAGAQFARRPLTCYMDIDDGIDLVERLYIPPKRQPQALRIGTQSPARRISPQPSVRRISPQPINRTVRNDVYSMPTTMPPLPHFRTVHKVVDPPLPAHCSNSLVDLPWSDPFGSYERMRRSQMHGPAAPLPVGPPMPSTSMAARQPRGILRHRSRSPPASEHPQLSATMRARLERAPNPAESMGIFAKMPPAHTYSTQFNPSSRVISKPAPPKPVPSLSSAVVFPPSPPAMGYRIVVSNLHAKVVHEDIEELFADIGDLMEARLVRPGVAEVIYRNLGDAEKAVDAYHNRQLDGQPMNCLLVNPRASNKPTAPALKFATR